MKTKLLYMVITAFSAGLLTEAVNEAIANGWTPLGGVSHSEDETTYSFAQAMTKKVKERKKL